MKHRRSPVVNPTKDDVAGYDDPVVREAAVDALGHEDGGVVVVDPNSGRILSAVNQPLVFSVSYIPCSTIKPVIAVAALHEGILTRDSMLRVSQRRYMNLTEALAHSNNTFFESLGSQMGFETVTRYAREFGLGEQVGRDIPEEGAGAVPATPPERGGVARMSSFGEGFRITPLQLAGVASTLANGGTLYYLQYPRTEEERQNFSPVVHRKLDVEPLLPDVREGMLAAVLYGTARRAFDPGGDEILGKTGTCSEDGRRLGWYVSYNNPEHPRLVVVVLLRGYRHRVNGPSASAVAGKIYHRLHELNYLAPVVSETKKPEFSLTGGR
ncbi:MAG TPA: penicillin-binding transpeptidase domain-containing protein [Candidatus Acidoferrales bacterium]|nr:penicillin-binding transpeptidase domain-containing protein [Candidatus Acidoferrales bacterium]